MKTGARESCVGTGSRKGLRGMVRRKKRGTRERIVEEGEEGRKIYWGKSTEDEEVKKKENTDELRDEEGRF